MTETFGVYVSGVAVGGLIPCLVWNMINGEIYGSMIVSALIVLWTVISIGAIKTDINKRQKVVNLIFNRTDDAE